MASNSSVDLKPCIKLLNILLAQEYETHAYIFACLAPAQESWDVCAHHGILSWLIIDVVFNCGSKEQHHVAMTLAEIVDRT